MRAPFDPEAFGAAMGDLIREAVEPLQERIAQLERHLAEAETRGIFFKGVYQRALTYTRGSVVTHGGSAWCCVVDETDDTPGAGKGWQLMIKGAR